MGDGSPRWPLPDAFDPTKPDPRKGMVGDVDGISVYRRHFHTPQEAADFRTKSKSQTWVAEIPAASITALGLTIEPKPLPATDNRPAQPGHAVLRELNVESRKTPQADQWKQQLLAAVTKVTGPYEAPTSRQEPMPPSA